MDFFKSLEADLEAPINKILDHPFLHRIRDGWLSREQLIYFTEQYGIYCRYFPRFLAALAANIPDDATRMNIVENLWEEHGEGRLTGAHRVLYERYATAVGLSVDQLNSAQPLTTTEICVENMLHTCAREHYLVGLGALGPGTEYFTDDEYKIISEGLMKYDFLDDGAIHFWTVHISLDGDHYQEMIEGMAPRVKTQEDQYLVRRGAEKALALEYLFWEGLEDHLPNK